MSRVACLFMAIMAGLCLTPFYTSVIAADLSGQLVISGSDTMEPMIAEMAKGFMNTYPGVKVVIRGGGSGKGIAETRSGAVSIGMSSRAITSQESVDLRAFTIAFEGICFITSEKNPVRNLTPPQLEGIFLGKIANWKDVGGVNLPITPMIRDRQSSSNKVVSEFLGVRVADLKGGLINDVDKGILLASKDSKAIFYASSGEVFEKKLVGMRINILSISGKKANMKTIAQNSYPLTRPLNLIVKGVPSPLVSAFISYCQSRSAAPVIRAHYFVKAE